MTLWSLIPYREAQPAENMALDEAMFLLAEHRNPSISLRFYGWNPPALSLGRHQPYPSALPEPRPVVVRRITGGKAVYHDQELTYSLVFPIDRPPFTGDLLTSYLMISKVLIAALQQLGLEAQAYSTAVNPALADRTIVSCFAVPGPFEITVNGKKLIGSAQRRGHRVAVQHGSILFSLDQAYYHSLFTDSEPRTVATSLTELLPLGISRLKVATLITEAFTETLESNPQVRAFSPEELRLAEQLRRFKHECPDWVIHGKNSLTQLLQ